MIYSCVKSCLLDQMLACLKLHIKLHSAARQIGMSSLRCRALYNLKTVMTFSSKSGIDLNGVYPPITTPFKKDGNVSFKDLEQNLNRWNEIPLKGYVLLGSTGESVLLDEKEKVDLVSCAKQHIPTGKLLIVGSGCESTKATIELTKTVAKVGADIAMVVTPSYYKGSMNEDALYLHYLQVAEASPIPVILYSVPPNTSIDLPASAIIRLASHPNIIGVKDSAGDLAKLGQIVYRTKNETFQVLAGSAGFFLPALLIGCVGGIFALANILGREICEVHQLYLQRKLNEACSLQQRLIIPNIAVTKKFGVSGVKTGMDWFGFYGGPLRSPLQPLSSESIESLRQDFKNNGFLPNGQIL